MTGADSLAPGDAIPVVDAAARAREARRLHHRQMIRRAVIAAPIVAIVVLLSALAVPVSNQLRTCWQLEAAGFKVIWQIQEDNWTTGGVTDVSFRQSSWLSGSYELELKMLPKLLNVEAVSLPECPVTEQGLAPLSELSDLRSLSLARLNHLHYGSSLTGLSDGCLIPIQGLSQLRILTLSGNRITDAGLAMISRLTDLEQLDLDATDVTDAGLVHLQGLKKLKSVSLGGTLVTPQGARTLQSALSGLEVNFDIGPEVEQNLRRLRREPR